MDISTSFAYTDMFGSVNLGWHLKRADVTAGYNLYMPTGTFTPNATDNTGLGRWGSEFTIGSTVYLDQKKMWNGAANFALEFNTDKSGTNIRPGDLGTVDRGLGKTFYKRVSGPVPLIMNLGAAAYAQFKIRGDSGSDIPPPLRGFKDRVFALGPEFTIFIPKPGLTFLGSLRARIRRAFQNGGPDLRVQHRLGGEVTHQTSAVKRWEFRLCLEWLADFERDDPWHHPTRILPR